MKKNMGVEVNINEKGVTNVIGNVSFSVIGIPNECYIVDVWSPDSEKYEIFYDGKKLNNVHGIILDAKLEDNGRQAILNWKKEIED